MPKNIGGLPIVQWPLFLLASKVKSQPNLTSNSIPSHIFHVPSLISVSLVISCPSLQVFLAKDIAVDCNDPQDELWLRISKDEYMQYAVEECFHSIKYILSSILDKEGHLW